MIYAPCIYRCDKHRGVDCPYKLLEDCPKYQEYDRARKEESKGKEVINYISTRQERIKKYYSKHVPKYK